MKLLSIIIPSYNMEALLPTCLDSLLVKDAELLQTLEVLVVNDGSTDKTSELAHRYATQYPGIFNVIDKPNGHYGSCINAALPRATGAYVKILDADDYVKTEALQSLLGVLQEEVAESLPTDVIISDWDSVNPDGEVVSARRYGFAPKKRFTMDEFDLLREGKGLIGIHAIVYRRAIFDRFSYHQTEGCAYTDTEWYSVPMAYAATVQYVPLCVTQYLVGRDGQSMDPKRFAQDFHILGKLALKMIRDYEALNEHATPGGKSYLAGQIGHLLRSIYHGALFTWEGEKVNIDLKTFDRELNAISPMFYNQLDAAKAPTRRFDYNYIREWRRGYRWFALRPWLYKTYHRAICVAFRVLKRAR